ncbi:tyrosine--tRNA ligase [archaeon]|nr:tyrosine--tRNA ligase [archaeon]
MDSMKRLELISRNTEEVLTQEDLRQLIEQGIKLNHYIGFEISGKIHLGTGLMAMQKVKDFMDAGVDCSVFLADWHTFINNKLGGDWDFIKQVAVGYFKEGMKASIKCFGGDEEKLKFVLGSDLYHNNDDYWQTVIDIAKNTSLARTLRSITIAGRTEGEAVNFALLMYPMMQVADIFIQGLNIAHAGMDQRKAHVIARDVALKLKFKPVKKPSGEAFKPIAIHHPLILGLQQPPVWPIAPENIKAVLSEMKMSKSIPSSAVFITDEPEVIRQKLKKAFCPEKNTDFNPVLNWAQRLVFSRDKEVLEIERPEKFGGNITYTSFADLEKDFAEGKLHPMDLKSGVAEKLVELLEPARKHFEQPKFNLSRLESISSSQSSRQ